MYLLSGIMFKNQVYNLCFSIAHHRLAGLIGIGCGDPGKQQSQEIIYFRHRTHSGARAAVHRLLLNGDYRAQACNLVHIRTYHIPDEMTRIGGECLHIPALAFGIDGVESEG